MTKFVSYLRVSTKRQGLSGLGLDAQREAIARYIAGAGVGGTLVAEFVEVESGKRSDNRPMLARALAACRLHGGATLIVAKLDRLSRNVAFVSAFLQSDCGFCAVDFPLANKFMLHLLAAVGEYEVGLISARTKAALAQCKKPLGGYRVPGKGKQSIEEIQPKGSIAGNAVRSAKAAQRRCDLLPIIAELQCDGLASLREIAEGLNGRGISTARGKAWSAVQVSRVLGTQSLSA